MEKIQEYINKEMEGHSVPEITLENNNKIKKKRSKRTIKRRF